MQFWDQLLASLKAQQSLVLLYVIDSQGSSPGRRGFHMMINDEGEMQGSIGGGIMEYKLLEWCKQELVGQTFAPFLKRQVHQDGLARDKSGMICSGEQTVAFYSLSPDDLPLAEAVAAALQTDKWGVLHGDEQGLDFVVGARLGRKFDAAISSPEHWWFKADLGFRPEMHIVGGGHVGLALSKMAAELGFAVSIYDDRKVLNTLARNHYAQRIWVPDYQQIGAYLPGGAHKYVVLMSFGYRTDKIILQQLIHSDFAYLGMMGSQAKVDRLFAEMQAAGTSQALLERVYAPIGIRIASQTPEEIAVSILAEVIQVKNRP